MFPPSSPLMERVRVEAEMRQLEQQASLNAQFASIRRWRLPKLFSFRKPVVEKRSTATVRPIKAEG
jgi:hypothetical protein